MGSSHALICGYCRFSVVRSDRELSALGKVADLVPTASPLAVGDTGSIAGKPFSVLGRVQLDHGRGPWDEWYLSFDNAWAWLARAQGRWYLTYEKDGSGLPAWDALQPGARGSFSGTGSIAWVVSERGGSALLSAEGELPFPVIPLSSGRYVDLEAEGAAFATVDYGDGSAPPKLFAGRQLQDGEVALKQTALGPRPTERVQVKKLVCPGCGAPVTLFVPDGAERVGCAACGALLDHSQGILSLLRQLDPPKIRPFIPLGSTGKLLGRRRVVIGFMQRGLVVEGERFTWREYLLYDEDAGVETGAASQAYTWLVEDNRHFVHVTPVSAASVKDGYQQAIYQGRRYQRFAHGTPVIDFVVGEFYWKAMVGDQSQTVDYVAPPRILSMERSANEVTWSEGEYLDPQELFRAFGLRDKPLVPIGVAPCQPNPHQLTLPAIVFAVLAALFLLVAIVFELGRDTRVVADTQLNMPPSDAAIAQGLGQRPAVTFLPPFDISQAPTTLKVEIETNVENGWASLGTSLLNETDGQVQELDLLAEHYAGVTDGESWSEGDADASGYFGKLRAGRYTVRLSPAWDAWPENPVAPAPTMRVRIVEGERSPLCCCGAFLLIALPFGLTLLRRAGFEQKRRENANP